jgi:methyl-accepting chemotaxis protein
MAQTNILFNSSLKQEATSFTLIIPVLIYFLSLFLPFLSNISVLIMIVIVSLAAIITGAEAKRSTVNKYKKCLSQQMNPELAMKYLTSIPLLDAVSVFLRWMISGIAVQITGYYFGGAQLQEIIIMWVFILPTALMAMPLFYLIAEKEVLADIAKHGDFFKAVPSNALRGISIPAKLLFTIFSLLIYVLTVLITLIILTAMGIFDPREQILAFILFGLSIAVITFRSGFLFVRNLAVRLKKVDGYVLQVSRGRFDHIAPDAKDELGVVIDSLNTMGEHLRKKQKIVESIAQGAGDFTIDVELAGNDDIFGKSLQKMLGSLNNILLKVQSAALEVSHSADQIEAASETLSNGAITQASAIEETSSSIQELSAQMLDNASGAEEAKNLMLIAEENAARGNSYMTNLLEGMKELNLSTGRIREIIEAIDDIAFQINLLALNANVEAARAGKFGKGFGVVADEVRNLANRSAHSVKETSQVIDRALKDVEKNNEFVEKSAAQLSEIVNVTNSAAVLVRSIADDAKSESNSLVSLTHSLGQIEEVSQANSSSAEESSSASQMLLNQARELEKLVSMFKLKAPSGLHPRLQDKASEDSR